MKNLTIITLKQPELTNFAVARNKALENVTTDWVLFIDSDEQLTPQLKDEIESAITSSNSPFRAYRLPRADVFLGRTLRHGENSHNRFVRLARRDWGRWERPVHEVWRGEGRIGDLQSPLIHSLGSVGDMITKINRYSSLESQFRHSEGRRSSLLHIALYPPAKFAQNYFFRLGFLDGVPGMIMAVLMSFHSFLTWSKLYLLQQKS